MCKKTLKVNSCDQSSEARVISDDQPAIKLLSLYSKVSVFSILKSVAGKTSARLLKTVISQTKVGLRWSVVHQVVFLLILIEFLENGPESYDPTQPTGF